MQHWISTSSATQALLLQDSWIETAKELVKDEFERSYVDNTDDDMDIEEPTPDQQKNKKVRFNSVL
jgi:hypothetical protein